MAVNIFSCVVVSGPTPAAIHLLLDALPASVANLDLSGMLHCPASEGNVHKLRPAMLQAVVMAVYNPKLHVFVVDK